MKTLATACAGFALLLATPVFADDAADAAAEAAAMKAIKSIPLNTNAGIAKAVPGTGSSVPATAGVPALIGHFIVIGLDELSAGLPCFYCAPAPGGGFGVALTIPMGTIPTTATSLDYSYMFQSTGTTAICTLAIVLMQGTTVLDAAAFNAGIYPSTWIVTFPRLRPAASGPATAHGLVSCGGPHVDVHTNVVLQ